jgi:hypothetical protein
VTEAKHADPDDGSFRSSLLRNGLGAVALVVAVAAMFWAIGSVGRAPVPQDIAAGEDTEDVDPEDAEDPAPEEPDEPDADDADESEGEDAEPDPGDTEGDADEADGDDAGDGSEGADEADDDTEGEDDESEPDPTPSIPPGDVTVQVLDGYQQDGGAAADAVQSQLDAAGYRIIARNPALRYDVTTVLWTAGNEEAGRQVAVELGAAEVREQPGNLSNAVMVHVVVGADRG